MIKRYKKQNNTSVSLYCLIYNNKDIFINNSLIDKEALNVVGLLQKKGYEAYIVGGAVRDLIISKQPKDIDISTSATPKEIKKLFPYSKIIGKRFKIVHLPYKDKILELSTFRSKLADEKFNNNIYGNMDEDANRRDFSINALYYNPFTSEIYDFHNGISDLNNHILTPIIPLENSFKDDPVRMIRAIKYAFKCSLNINKETEKQIYKDGFRLLDISEGRISEEFNKILTSGCSFDVINNLNKYNLLLFICPHLAYDITSGNVQLLNNLKKIDTNIGKKIIDYSELYCLLCEHSISKKSVLSLPINERFQFVENNIRKYLKPLFPQNKFLDGAVYYYLLKNKIPNL